MNKIAAAVVFVFAACADEPEDPRSCSEFTADTHTPWIPDDVECIFGLESAPDADRTGGGLPYVLLPAASGGGQGGDYMPGLYKWPASRWAGDEGEPGVVVQLTELGRCQWIRCTGTTR